MSINFASQIAPVYGRAWIHPRSGEVRYYVNNARQIADARNGKAWITADGQLHFADMYEGGQARVRASVEAHDLPVSPEAQGGSLGALLAADFDGTMTRMMDEGWQ